jgi:hypothetical protein
MKQTIFSGAMLVLALAVQAQATRLLQYNDLMTRAETSHSLFTSKQTTVSNPVLTPTPLQTSLPCARAGDITPAILQSIAARRIHSGGGCIRTPLVVDGALRLGAGTYQVVQPIAVKSEGSIVGAGWNTVITESSVTDQLVVIVGSDAYGGAIGTNTNITLKNFKIMGAKNIFRSAPQTVQLGNCANCVVDGLWLDRTHTIGIQLGGSARDGHYARDSKISNNLLTQVASQGIAVVNGENIEISNNRILRPGQQGGPGTSSIDLEVNDSSDRLINIRVINNLIDHRESEMIGPTGNGIIANSGHSQSVNGIVIDNNTVIGGELGPPVIPHLSNGIMVTGKYMAGTRVTRNKISRTSQTGMWLSGKNLVCEDNAMDSVGGGGIAGFRVDDVHNSIIRRNHLVCTNGPCDERMEIIGAAVGNTIAENGGWVMTRVAH